MLESVAISLLQGDLPAPGIKPGSPALQADSLPSKPPEEPLYFNFFSFFKQELRKQDPRNCLIQEFLTASTGLDRYLRLSGPRNLHYTCSVILRR